MGVLCTAPTLINLELSNEPADGYCDSHVVDIPTLGAGG